MMNQIKTRKFSSFNDLKISVKDDLRNKIKENILRLKPESLIHISFINGAKNDIESCIESILSAHKDNFKAIEAVLGYITIKMIYDYKNY